MPLNEAEEKLKSAFWQAVAEHGWAGASVAKVAALSGIPPQEVRRLLPSRRPLLFFLEPFDEPIGSADPEASTVASPRDSIFEAAMARFDAMQPHRQGIVRFFQDMPTDPLLAFAAGEIFTRNLIRLPSPMTLLGGGVPALSQEKLTSAAWALSVNAWLKDEAEDLGLTMKALDRALDRLEALRLL